jgi:hypothetical protein
VHLPQSLELLYTTHNNNTDSNTIVDHSLRLTLHTQLQIQLLRVAIDLNSACVLLRPGIPRELLDLVFLCIWHVDTDIRVWPWECLVAALQDLCTVREILARDRHKD